MINTLFFKDIRGCTRHKTVVCSDNTNGGNGMRRPWPNTRGLKEYDAAVRGRHWVVAAELAEKYRLECYGTYTGRWWLAERRRLEDHTAAARKAEKYNPKFRSKIPKNAYFVSIK